MLGEEYNRALVEQELRELRQLIDNLKGFHYFIPLSSAPNNPKVGTVAYNDGTDDGGTFGSSSEGLYRYASNDAWHKIG